MSAPCREHLRSPSPSPPWQGGWGVGREGGESGEDPGQHRLAVGWERLVAWSGAPSETGKMTGWQTAVDFTLERAAKPWVTH